MTLHYEVYKIAQQLLRLATESNNKDLMRLAIELGLLSDKIERETRAH